VESIAKLGEVARGLVNEGQSRETVVQRLECLRQELRAAGRDGDEDAVLDVLDFLTGWCSPHQQI
jgi:hypothetical protein